MKTKLFLFFITIGFFSITQAQNVKNHYPEIFKQESGAMKVKLMLSNLQDSQLLVINKKALLLLDSVYAMDSLSVTRKTKLDAIINGRQADIVQILTQVQTRIFTAMLESSRLRNEAFLNKTGKATTTH